MSLAHRLQREVKAHPAKAGALIVLLLVAGYFWAPLVKGWFAPGPAEVAAPPTPEQVASNTTSPVPVGQSPSAEAPQYEWRKHSKAIDDDARMTPGAEMPADRDPFASQRIEPQPPPEPASAQQSAAVQRITPDDAGLVLSTTLLSPRKQIAEISGKSYSPGDRIEIVEGDLHASFRVLEIHPRKVVLESAGERFELRIPRPLVDSVAESRGELPAPAQPTPDERRTSGRESDEDEAGSATQ